jgi:ankyrin repeat protein
VKNVTAWIFTIAFLTGFGLIPKAMAAPPGIDIWKAAAEGNIKAIKKHAEAGTYLDAKEPAGGSTPLHFAAIFGQTKSAEVLIENDASIDIKNNDGGTALHNAAFFGNIETVKFLLDKGADVNARTLRSETPLDIVSGDWSPELEGLYKFIEELLQIKLDMKKIKSARPKIAAILRKHATKTSDIDIWHAAKDGDMKVVKKYISSGKDVNIRNDSGRTLLMFAAVGGQTEIAELLIEEGADVNMRGEEGESALHAAAFFCHTEIVKLLIDKGADVNARNIRSEKPLDSVAGQWSQELGEIYEYHAGMLQIEVDLERIKAARPKIAVLLRKNGAKTSSDNKLRDVPIKPTRFKGSYFKDGEIHVNTYGTPEGKPLTNKKHWDFKPSWSKTGDMLVFFRRLVNHPVTAMWKTAICIINVDGTGFHKLTDGTHTDFNQTWTRDGTNTPIWNRKNPLTGSFYVMQSKVGNRPGQEVSLTDKNFHTWAYTCLMDGRILVQSAHPRQGQGYYLMTRDPGGEPRFERIDCELAKKGILDRVSVSPSEKMVCFEYQRGFRNKETGRTLYIADFDAKGRTITNARPFANEEGANRWFAYPRWTKDEKAIVYHASPSLYLYTLEDGSTIKVSTNDSADYRYPHCEAAPK